jgi:hypothetical protein
MVKPEFFRDKKIASLGPVAALVFEALWCLADDGGVAPGDPERIHGEMFVWWEAINLDSVRKAVGLLEGSGRIRLYKVGDEQWAEIPNFLKHQIISHPSRFRFPRESSNTPGGLQEGSRRAPPPKVIRNSDPDPSTDTDHAHKCAAPAEPEATLFPVPEPERHKPGRKPKKREDPRAWRIVKAWISSWRFWGKGAEPVEAKREGKTYDSILPLLESNSEEEIKANLERYIKIKFREGRASYAHVSDFVKTFGDHFVFPVGTRCRVYYEGQWGKPDGQGSFLLPVLWADGATVDMRDESGEDTILPRSQFEREDQAKRAPKRE